MRNPEIFGAHDEAIGLADVMAAVPSGFPGADLWKVVGGHQSGGLIVRCGSSLSSAVEEQKLAPDALVREVQNLEPAGNRGLDYVSRCSKVPSLDIKG